MNILGKIVSSVSNKNHWGVIFFFVFCAFMLILSIRGLAGNPTPEQLNTLAWRDNGPFELSPERGRFTLLYALVENHSFSFGPDLARFATPDVGYLSGKYESLFAPGLSFLVIPGYVVGKMFGIAQVGTVAVISLFALLNAWLIRSIAIRLGAHPIAATISAFAFLFASPAFTYAVTLYQHHVSTFLILLSLYLLIRFTNFWSLAAVWLLCAFSISVDYPNAFMMLPIGVAALARTILVKRENERVSISSPVIRIFAFVGVILPLIFFFWFNAGAYGNPLRLAGSLPQVQDVAENGKPVFKTQDKATLKQLQTHTTDSGQNIITFFKTRNLINGFYTHFISPDRGMVLYTPVMLFGFLGFFFLFKRQKSYFPLLTAILGFNILLYSMWGDPWGGWAFGSRYLIPSYAVLSILMAMVLTKFKNYNVFLLVFAIVFSYSLAVNTLGAITSSKNPPQGEAKALEQITKRKEEYTYLRNVEMLDGGNLNAFVFTSYARNYVSAWSYYSYLSAMIIIFGLFLMVYFKSVVQEESLSSKGGIYAKRS